MPLAVILFLAQCLQTGRQSAFLHCICDGMTSLYTVVAFAANIAAMH